MSYPVAIQNQPNAAYPDTAPYDAPEVFPESPFPERLDAGNGVYATVRESFRLLKLDEANDGTAEWNPLGGVVRPGDTVFIKPNMIAHKHALNEDWDYVITHGSVLRAVVDYVFIALKGEGKIQIGDAPQTDSKYDLIIGRMGLPELQALYRDEKEFEIELIDLRDEHWIEKDGIYVETIKLEGDPLGGVEADLANDSMFAELDGQGKKYYGAFYDTDETNQHHLDGKHEYAISRTPIEADVFINVPKLKTHKKCGITVNLKSLVGINANKNWLPHYVIGSPKEGGDQFPASGAAKGKLENALVLTAKKFLARENPVVKFAARKLKKLGYFVFGGTEEMVRSGNWHGNDTVWRMSVDLNRILMFGNPDGTLRPGDQPKRFFSIVDGIVAMEGNGPVAGTSKPTGLIIAGDNPVAVDAVCAATMGFDCRKLPLVHRCLEPHRLPLIDGGYNDIEPISSDSRRNRPVLNWMLEPDEMFRPHFGWKGHVEKEQS